MFRMQKPFVTTGVGLAVDDKIFYVKDGVSYDDLRWEIQLLPAKEGGLTEVSSGYIDEVLGQVGKSSLFKQGDGEFGLKIRRNMGGGLNGLAAMSSLAWELRTGGFAGCFALGSKDGKYDESARYLLEGAEKFGIDMSQCFPLEGETARTVAIARRNDVGKLERTFIHNPGVANDASYEDYAQALKNPTKAAIFYYLNIAKKMCADGTQDLRRLFADLQSRDVMTVLDTGGNEERMMKLGKDGRISALMAVTDFFAPSADEVNFIPGNSLYEKAMGDSGLQMREPWAPGVLVFKRGVEGNELYTSPDSTNLDRVAGLMDLDINRWSGRAVSSRAIRAEKKEDSVGGGDKSLALGVLGLCAGLVKTPQQLTRLMNVGGALAISGQEFNLENVEDLMENGRDEIA